MHSAALNAGAYGMVISGAGPTLLALTNLSTSSTVVKAMTDTWKNQGVVTQVQVLEINATGAVCV